MNIHNWKLWNIKCTQIWNFLGADINVKFSTSDFLIRDVQLYPWVIFGSTHIVLVIFYYCDRTPWPRQFLVPRGVSGLWFWRDHRPSWWGSMATRSRHGEILRAHILYHKQRAESKLETGKTFDSQRVLPETVLLAKLPFLNLSKLCQQHWAKCSNAQDHRGSFSSYHANNKKLFMCYFAFFKLMLLRVQLPH